MSVIRRIYFYLLAFAGLGMLAFGVANLGRVLVEVLDGSSLVNPERYVRDEVSRWGAASLVGLPVWVLHWWAAQRSAASSAGERASTLRRLYVYAVLASATIGLAIATQTVLAALLESASGPATAALRRGAETVPFLVVAAVVWAYHWRVASADRALVGEHRGSATLRRWYVYGLAFGGFAVLLDGASRVLEETWRLATGAVVPSTPYLSNVAAAALVGLVLWLVHWRWAPRTLGPMVAQQDHTATLRSVYLFLALALAVWNTLYGASQLLYYALARLLGVEQPGGVGGSVLQAAAGPASMLLVYGVGWAYQRGAIRQQAATVEAPRQAGVRRLYTYLVALLSIAALAVGVGGLLWTLADAFLSAPGATASAWWRNQLALYAMLALVGLPVWLTHWRPSSRVAADEAHALSRRLYVYLALIGGMLTLLGSAAVLLYRVLNLLLGELPSAGLTADLAHALGVALVAAAVAAYHWRTLAADTRRAAAVPAPAAAPSELAAEAVVRLRAPSPAALAEALDTLRARGLQVEPAEPAP